MEDYTKFKLKSEDELIPVLENNDGFFVVACNKCFKEFELDDEPEYDKFQEIAANRTKLLGCSRIDFLCNKTTTEKKLTQLPSEAKNVFVISCGLGVQTVADLVELPAYAACDSINYRGYHGMALTERRCDACGQCYLNDTGGVCPIVDCSKSLVNGQCGGCKDGKCEVDKNLDCAWEKIYKRMEAQSRLNELSAHDVQIRDYSKINFKFVKEYVTSIREKRLDGFYGGIHPSERKEISEHIDLISFPNPKTVVIPMSQHVGAPASAIVAAGDTVKVGQKIGEAGGFVSSPIHASISGVVRAVEPHIHPVTGAMVESVVIDSDGKNTLCDTIVPRKDPDSLTGDEVIEIVREAGIVGMGGAGFPTSVKLKAPKPIDTVLLNGCECEPLLTADHKLMINFADDIIYGLKVLIKTVGAQKGVIVIEDNKQDAVEIIESKIKANGETNIEVAVAKCKYPQGAEKTLIKRVLGRQVPSGGLPMDVGALVSNVSTAKAVSDALKKGMPLIERVLTVSGERIKKPGNYIVKIGTSIKEIIEYSGGTVGDDVVIKLGGPMMGFEIENTEVPVIKGTNGIIAVEKIEKEKVACIKCGRCADVCPMELAPLYYPKLVEKQDWEGMRDRNVKDCVECRCCEFICAARIPLVTDIKTGKKAIMEMERK